MMDRSNYITDLVRERLNTYGSILVPMFVPEYRLRKQLGATPFGWTVPRPTAIGAFNSAPRHRVLFSPEFIAEQTTSLSDEAFVLYVNAFILYISLIHLELCGMSDGMTAHQRASAALLRDHPDLYRVFSETHQAILERTT